MDLTTTTTVTNIRTSCSCNDTAWKDVWGEKEAEFSGDRTNNEEDSDYEQVSENLK